MNNKILKKYSANKISGFGLFESLIALALFATLISSILMLNNNMQRKNEARELAAQTEAFAFIFTKYMHDNYDKLSTQWQNAPLTLNPYMLGDAWPIDTVKQNFYRQTPCVTIVKNPITGNEEALMYYVGGKNFSSLENTRTAVLQLGRSGGLLINNNVFGNSGWMVTMGSKFLSDAARCGAVIANNSLAIKLDLLEGWNQNLQLPIALNRGLDIGVADKPQTLPGHMLNTNTSKSTIYFANNKGVILDNDQNSLLKLSVQNNGHGTGAATLGLGANSSSLIADMIQPTYLGRAGDSCNYQEIGKVIADRGLYYEDALSHSLSRNTLVCTQNNMLCAHANASRTCYLSSVANQITFRNVNTGIQNTGGEFRCPASIPFLVRAEPGISNGGINRVGIYVTRSYGFNDIRPANVRCRPGNAPGIKPEAWYCFWQDNYGPPDPDSIVNPNQPDHFVSLNRNIGPGLGTTIVGHLNGYTTNIGYKIHPFNPINLKSLLNSAFDEMGRPADCTGAQDIRDFNSQGIHYSYLYCNNLFGYFRGMIVVVRSNDPSLHGVAIIKQATCSNSPIYVQR